MEKRPEYKNFTGAAPGVAGGDAGTGTPGAELWDLYDMHRRPLHRLHPRGTPLTPGEYHLVVEIWVANSQNQLLTTLRSPEKHLCPGLWEQTTGSALAGESSRTAAARELREETGIAAGPDELVCLGSFVGTSALHDIYLLRRDVPLAKIALQPGETMDARWITPEQLCAMLTDGSFAYVPSEGRTLTLQRLLAAVGAPHLPLPGAG